MKESHFYLLMVSVFFAVMILIAYNEHEKQVTSREAINADLVQKTENNQILWVKP